MTESFTINSWTSWESRFASFLQEQVGEMDSAHDQAHVERVVAMARQFAKAEDANLEVVIPAAWLHDCVVVPKDDPRRAQASRLASEKARDYLSKIGYPKRWIEPIAHAILAHSYSADITPRTIEAKVVQDADRVDALGAVGLARCFMVGGEIGNKLYNPSDPFCKDREPDDNSYSIDHFYEKLLQLPATMQTEKGRKEAKRRANFLRQYLDELKVELKGTNQHKRDSFL